MTELELNITALKYSTSEPDEKFPGGYLQIDWEIFLVLQDFLQPHSRLSTDEAVDKIIALFPNSCSNLRAINDVCLELAEEIPYYHPSQLKLVRLLWLIGRNHTRIEKCRLQDKSAASDVFYQHLIEDITDNNRSPEDDEVTPDQYVNYQAFLANLMAAGLWLPSPNDALMAMRGAFKPRDESESLATREAWIMGAVQWILWNGQGLFKLLLWQTDTQLHDEGWLTHKSWQEWKAGFQGIAKSEMYGEKCRSITAHTAQLMHAIETTYSWVT